MHSTEPAHALAALEAWRASQVHHLNNTPIFLAVLSDQKVFNGYGAQETCDMLFLSLLSPLMPAHLVCSHLQLWERFKKAVIKYQADRIRIVGDKLLPFVSCNRPFFMNVDGHNRFLTHVSTYRRKNVLVDQPLLTCLHNLGLLEPSATIQDDGSGQGV